MKQAIVKGSLRFQKTIERQEQIEESWNKGEMSVKIGRAMVKEVFQPADARDQREDGFHDHAFVPGFVLWGLHNRSPRDPRVKPLVSSHDVTYLKLDD
jgi:hypothetical protein